MSNTNRYSDRELELFKINIEQKKEKAENDLHFLLKQMENITEATSKGDWKENTSSSDLEMLSTMANRHRHHLQDLKNALIRIQNKNYGICSLTGELIDKRRLMAVPITTKSLAAKMQPPYPKKKTNESPFRVIKMGTKK